VVISVANRKVGNAVLLVSSPNYCERRMRRCKVCALFAMAFKWRVLDRGRAHRCHAILRRSGGVQGEKLYLESGPVPCQERATG
jgi:hypothetical protein